MENPHLALFAVGFFAFVVALAMYSPRLSGVCGGGILMAVAIYPIVRLGKP